MSHVTTKTRYYYCHTCDHVFDESETCTCKDPGIKKIEEFTYVVQYECSNCEGVTDYWYPECISTEHILKEEPCNCAEPDKQAANQRVYSSQTVDEYLSELEYLSSGEYYYCDTCGAEEYRLPHEVDNLPAWECNCDDNHL